MEWIVPANRDLYEHEDAFNKLPYIDWTQDCNYDVGDRVYIYTSTPYHKIEYLVEVIKTDIKSTSNDFQDDKVFWKDLSKYNEGIAKDRFARFKLLYKFYHDAITYEELKKHGLLGLH